MMHNRRIYSVQNVTPEEMVKWLSEYSMVLCTGFRCNGHLWLNDSFTEDSLQEYAVIREATGEQVDSITVTWMSKQELLEYIAGLGKLPAEFGKVDLTGRIQTPEEHGRCHLCM